MELRHSSCNCNTDGNSVQSCCFNPVIFFVCKFCRGAFENADKLILHKRQQHSLKDLKGIKFIIFEERFVETDDSTFRNELTSTVAPLRSEIANNSSDINSVPPLQQDDSPADPEIETIIDITDESEEFKLPNPFVHLRQLTSKEINSYSRPTAATNQNQEAEEFNVSDHDERCEPTTKQSISCDKTTTNIDPRSINNCSDSTSNENVSADLGINDPAPEIIAGGEFIVVSVVQSSNGTGIVQFVSACVPAIPEKESQIVKKPAVAKPQQLNFNKAVGEHHRGSDVDLFETEKDSEFDNLESFAIIPEVASDDAGGPPTPMPVPLEVVPSLTEAQIKTEDHAAGKISNSEVAELSVEVNIPQISVCPPTPTETETLVQVSSPSMRSARPLRNRSKINYSENQACAKCSRDFCTVEELETHEKLCLRNQTNRKQGHLRKRGLNLMTISDGPQATHDSINDNDKIQVIQTAAISPNPNDLQVKVTDNEGDQDNNCPDVISSSSDSEFKSSTVELNFCKKQFITGIIPTDADVLLRSPDTNVLKNKAVDKNNSIKNQNKSSVTQPTVTGTEKPEDYAYCPLSLNDWIRKEKAANPENIILLDPDPFQAEADTNKEVETPVFVVTSQNPTKCKLCIKQLTSDLDAKRHLKFCWTKNKTKHVHCLMCSKSYSNPNGLHKHRKVKHLKPGETSLSFKCTICSKELATQLGFKHHMEVHKNPNLKPFVCEICGSRFRLKFKLQQHQLSHSEDRPFKCELCPKAFKNKEHLRSHRNVHIEISNYHCLPCSKSFKSNDLLQKHTRRTHLKDKWHPCKAEHCDLKFPLKASLWRHCQKDHNKLYLQMATVSCTVCSKKFMMNSQLERHMFSHGRERPFKCSEEGCNGTFTTKQSLEEHLRMHTGERPYQCDQCGSTFARLCLFLIHLKEHKNPKVRVLCHLCPKTFSRNWELQQHLTFHEKGRQFSCEKCDSKFMSKSHLKGHMKTHERKDATDDVSSSSSSESEVESEEGTTQESEPESE